MPEPDLFRAKMRFYDVENPAAPVLVLEGTLARAGHPIIKRNPTVWEPADVAYDVEQPLNATSEKDELDRLRPEAIQLGINVDGRWSAKRLRAEIEKVKAQQAEMGQ